jgi:transposase
VVGAVPQHYGANVTMLAALSLQGVEAVMTVDGATDAAVFRAYVEEVLCPTLVPVDIVIMDDLRAHKVVGIHERIEACGAQLLYVPPYSPDLSPIAPCWSKLKTLLRTGQARPRDALDAAIQQILAAVTPSDARGWFRHGGYALRQLETRSKHLQTHAAPQFPGLLPGSPSFGAAESSCVTSGGNDYVNLGQPVVLDFTPNTDPSTIAVWVNLDTWVSGEKNILSKGSLSQASSQYQIYLHPTGGELKAVVGGTGINSGRTDVDGTGWPHIVLRNYGDGGTMKFQVYVDGDAVGSPQNSGSSTETEHVLIGALGSNPAGRFVKGLIDGVRIYNRALSTGEISGLCNGGAGYQ